MGLTPCYLWVHKVLIGVTTASQPARDTPYTCSLNASLQQTAAVCSLAQPSVSFWAPSQADGPQEAYMQHTAYVPLAVPEQHVNKHSGPPVDLSKPPVDLLDNT